MQAKKKEEEEEDFIQHKHKSKITHHNNVYSLWKAVGKAQAIYAGQNTILQLSSCISMVYEAGKQYMSAYVFSLYNMQISARLGETETDR